MSRWLSTNENTGSDLAAVALVRIDVVEHLAAVEPGQLDDVLLQVGRDERAGLAVVVVGSSSPASLRWLGFVAWLLEAAIAGVSAGPALPTGSRLTSWRWEAAPICETCHRRGR